MRPPSLLLRCAQPMRKGNDEASRLIRAGSADAEDVVVLARLHAVGDIGGILVGIVGTLLDASKEHPRDLLGASQLQVLGKLFFVAKPEVP